MWIWTTSKNKKQNGALDLGEEEHSLLAWRAHMEQHHQQCIWWLCVNFPPWRFIILNDLEPHRLNKRLQTWLIWTLPQESLMMLMQRGSKSKKTDCMYPLIHCKGAHGPWHHRITSLHGFLSRMAVTVQPPLTLVWKACECHCGELHSHAGEV